MRALLPPYGPNPIVLLMVQLDVQGALEWVQDELLRTHVLASQALPVVFVAL